MNIEATADLVYIRPDSHAVNPCALEHAVKEELESKLNRPLNIAGRTIAGRLTLAPMTYLGHVAFRELVASFGGYGLLFTEMCSARRIPFEDPGASRFFRWRLNELPSLVCQIVGGDPPTMAEAARVVEGAGFFGVDINFGCSVATICKRHCGAALLKQPSRAAAIVSAVRKAVTIPLFVKFRTGWQDDPAAAVEMARLFEQCGADALTFHPRVAPDRRSRPPKWAYIGMVKRAVSIPVFGNGNVFSRADCKRMLDSTACDGIAVGRMAIARPWIFAEWSQGLLVQPELYYQTARQLIDLLLVHFDEKCALRRIKKFALYFAANFRFGHLLCSRIKAARHTADVRETLKTFFRSTPDLALRPNMNLFNG